jgi:hypothetical protein
MFDVLSPNGHQRGYVLEAAADTIQIPGRRRIPRGEKPFFSAEIYHVWRERFRNSLIISVFYPRPPDTTADNSGHRNAINGLSGPIVIT